MFTCSALEGLLFLVTDSLGSHKMTSDSDKYVSNFNNRLCIFCVDPWFISSSLKSRCCSSVAVQCLETAFEVSTDDQSLAVPLTLPEIFASACGIEAEVCVVGIFVVSAGGLCPRCF